MNGEVIGQFQRYVIAGGAFCTVMALFTVGLLAHWKRRRQTQQVLTGCRQSIFGGIFPNALMRQWTQTKAHPREALSCAVLASLPGQVAVVDRVGTIIAVNETWHRFARAHHAGPSNRVGVGANYLEVCRRAMQTSDSAAAAALAGIEAVLDGSRSAFSLEYGCALPAEELWYTMSVEPLKRREGGAVISHQDITDWKRAEEAQNRLAQQVVRERQHLNDIVANVPGIVWEAKRGPDNASHHLNFVSHHVEKMLGYSLDEWVSIPNFWLAIVHPDDRERASRESDAIFASRHGGVHQFRWMAKDGRILWVEAHLAVISDESGEPIGLRGVTMDITAHKRMEEALRASAWRYRAIVEQQTDLICRFLPDTTLTFVNEAYCRYFGKTRQELIGHSFLSLIPEEARRAALEHVRSLCKHPRIDPYEHPAIGANGEIRWQQWVDRQILDDSGRIMEFQSVGRDVTERRRAEAALQRAQAELAHVNRVLTMGELAASLAHEISQPLTAILSNAQAAQRLLDADLPDLSEVRAILVDIVEDDRRAGEVIRRLRSFLGRSEVELQPLNLNLVIQEVVCLVSNDAMLRHVAIALDLDPALPLVLGDRVLVQQVVLNLMLNGFDAMGELKTDDRRLVVRTQREGAGPVQTAVQDCGGGMEEDKLTRMFDPFFTTKPEGMGMGLSICRSIIEAHGGYLWAVNNPNRGMTFHFTLPLSSQQERL